MWNEKRGSPVEEQLRAKQSKEVGVVEKTATGKAR